MPDPESTDTRFPTWGIVLMVLAAALLLWLPVHVFIVRPHADQPAVGPVQPTLWEAPTCDALAKIATCAPLSLG